MSAGLSVIVPAYNERESLAALVRETRAALDPVFDWQLILVDDGSSDGSAELLDGLSVLDARLEVVRLPHNQGQSAAIVAGAAVARHSLIATMDADLQQDPKDFVGLHRALGALDAIVGFREDRQDRWVRRVSSRIANGFRNRVTGDTVRDSGCSMRIVRRPAFEAVLAFDGMHRFLPTLLRIEGFSVGEHPVSHRRRIHGKSKYGTWGRALRGIPDVLAVRWLAKRWIRRPGDVRSRTKNERRPPRSA